MAEADVSLRDHGSPEVTAQPDETKLESQSPDTDSPPDAQDGATKAEAEGEAREGERLEDVQLYDAKPAVEADAQPEQAETETTTETETETEIPSAQNTERIEDDVSPGIASTRQDEPEKLAPEHPQIVVEPSEPVPVPESEVQTPLDARHRSASVATNATHRSTPLSSIVFVINALDSIAQSREAKRTPELQDAVNRALENIKQSEHHHIDPEVIFHPLQLASKSFSIPLQVTALDCIGKLITYSYFAFPSRQHSDGTRPVDKAPLIERAIETICDCFENESTPVEIQQQIIKSLLAAVLNDKIVVHGAGLLKAVRQIYNIFIYSKSSQNQHIAQGSLTQMVGTVYDRVRVRLEVREARLREEEGRDHSDTDSPAQTGDATPIEQDTSEVGSNMVSDQPVSKEPAREKLTLQDFELNRDDTIVNDTAPTMVTRAKSGRKTSRSFSADEDMEPSIDEEDEIYVKDAFLVFRALCKLSQKVLTHEQQQDIKSQNMRSKLLSLHLMQHLLNNHIAVFVSPVATIKNNSSSGENTMTLLQAIKPHLCLCLSRNGASSVPRVFEVCCEIFWLMLKHMRVMLKVSNRIQLLMTVLTQVERVGGLLQGDLPCHP